MTTSPKPAQKAELIERIGKLHSSLERSGKEWSAAFIINRISLYYFTGTIQDGVLVLKKDGSYSFFVRRSMERAKSESPLDDIHAMKSYADVRAQTGELGGIFLETGTVTVDVLGRIKKYFPDSDILPLDGAVMQVRSIKSAYELEQTRISGNIHNKLLRERIPTVLREGMSEVDLCAAMYSEMLSLGYHGVTRFGMFQTESMMGQLGFGVNSIYPTCFDGPGGMRGLYPAVPIIGDRERKLAKGDLVFVDVGCGYNGYHTDSTQVYMFGAKPDAEMVRLHRACIDVEKRTAAMLKPGAIPSEIYEQIMATLDADFLRGFMGYSDPVSFLGHGVGLQVDELPVIAKGFKTPLEKGMIIALEPKRGIEGVGLVGVEDTYLVTEDGGECLTGGEQDIMVV